MNRQMAENLIRIYCSAWLGQDCRAAMSVLDGQAGILECTGTAYDGRAEAKRWFEDWHRQGGRVTEWLVTDVDYDDEKNRAVAEWQFACVWQGVPYSFCGCSLVKFNSSHITQIKEFRMEKQKVYPYREKKLLAKV